MAADNKPPAGAVAAPQALQELRRGGADAPALHLDATGVVRSVTAAPGKKLGDNADAFVRRYAAAFGMSQEHSVGRISATSIDGARVLRYQQNSAGLPVLGGEVVVLTDSDGSVRSVITDVTPSKPTAGSAKISTGTARTLAANEVQKRFDIAADVLGTLEVKLWLYNPALIGAPGANQLRPTYWVSAHGIDGQELATVLVDAVDGKIMLAASEHQSAKNRLICDLANKRVNLDVRANYACAPGTALAAQSTTKVEGGPWSGIPDTNKAYDYLGRAYDYYKTNFGRDSFDDRGAQLRATVRACHSDTRYACPFRNAFWEGTQFVFGEGFVVDDVTAHEYTHAVTHHASGLYYWYQSGAINEALSDIFGEFIDQSYDDGPTDTSKPWLLGEDLPGGAIRSMSDPTAYGDPDRVDYSRWDTDEEQYDNGGVHTNSGPANKAAFLIAAGGTFQGYTMPGIGLEKSGQLWYRVMHSLPSGANYEELGFTLSSVCRSLIGHFGITVADCTNTVDKAVQSTYMHNTPGGSGVGETEARICGDSSWEVGPPPVDLFFDDMERTSSNWTRSNSRYWAQLPDSNYRYSYAAHGRGSMNGWTAAGETGSSTYIEMANAVTLPADKTPIVHFAHSMIKYPLWSSTGHVAIQVQANGGAWAPFSGNWEGSEIYENRLARHTQGFGSSRLDFSAYKGKSIKVRFKLVVPSGDYLDWYFDDFRVFTCDSTIVGAPRESYVYKNSNGAVQLTWGTPAHVNTGSYKWELSYSPAIPGAPSVVDQNHTAPYLNQLVLAGADPNLNYTITIAARTEDGRLGTPVTLKYSPSLPAVCPSYLLRLERPLLWWTAPQGCRPWRGPAIVRR